MGWLAGDGAEVRPAMELDNLEAVRAHGGGGPRRLDRAGSGGVGAASPAPRSSARPLEPALTRTLALAQRRDKPSDPALAHVREALLSLAE